MAKAMRQPGIDVRIPVELLNRRRRNLKCGNRFGIFPGIRLPSSLGIQSTGHEDSITMKVSEMLSDLDTVLIAMANRDRQLQIDPLTVNPPAECSVPVVAPPVPRPKGARVNFTPSTPAPETR